MNPTLKNVLAVIAGIIIGSIINMGLIILGSSVIPVPEGVDAMDPESLKNSMHLFEGKHFIFPFLGHALGTLFGAFWAARIAANKNMMFALGIGAFFLIGGVVNVINLPAPTWFEALDLIVAYLPAAWLGGKLGMKKQVA